MCSGCLRVLARSLVGAETVNCRAVFDMPAWNEEEGTGRSVSCRSAVERLVVFSRRCFISSFLNPQDSQQGRNPPHDLKQPRGQEVSRGRSAPPILAPENQRAGLSAIGRYAVRYSCVN